MESQGRAHGKLVDSAHRASYPLVSLPRKINTSGQMSQRPEAASQRDGFQPPVATPSDRPRNARSV